MENDNSINRLFLHLPDFIKNHNIILKEYHSDENALLSETIGKVTKIRKPLQRIHKKSVRKIHFFHAGNTNHQFKMVLDEDNINTTNLPEYMEGYADGLHPLIMEKLRSGEYSVQKTLDLHGCPVDEADKKFQYFIKEALRAGLYCVKVIHGRGLKSKKGPVIKERLKEWIIRAMHRKWIIAFSSATMPDGGPGATYIILKKKPLKKNIHIMG
ncbi:MAG TPA: hypothetical protein DDW17_02820 [Deltaproteobacteria bacterium]|nr:hypothetical protein [Deltaproteobacteria bacterium]